MTQVLNLDEIVMAQAEQIVHAYLDKTDGKVAEPPYQQQQIKNVIQVLNLQGNDAASRACNAMIESLPIEQRYSLRQLSES